MSTIRANWRARLQFHSLSESLDHDADRKLTFDVIGHWLNLNLVNIRRSEARRISSLWCTSLNNLTFIVGF